MFGHLPVHALPHYPRNATKVSLGKAALDVPHTARAILALISSLFTREHGFSFVRLDGSSNQKRRTEVIREFQNAAADSPTIMLLSLKAGGVGLNLTAASHVFLMDPVRFDYSSTCFLSCRRSRSSQSPAFVLGLESRYRGAVHRPLPPSGTDEESYRHQGQKSVQRFICVGSLPSNLQRHMQHEYLVFNVLQFIVKDSVEERMMAIQRKKQDLMEKAFGSTGSNQKTSRIEEIKALMEL